MGGFHRVVTMAVRKATTMLKKASTNITSIMAITPCSQLAPSSRISLQKKRYKEMIDGLIRSGSRKC